LSVLPYGDTSAWPVPGPRPYAAMLGLGSLSIHTRSGIWQTPTRIVCAAKRWMVRNRRTRVDHTEFAEARDPDTELHLDDEKDTLYNDGLDIEDDSETLADTKGNTNRG